MASLQLGPTSAAVSLGVQADRTATRTAPGNLNIMRRAAVSIIIADYQHGEAAAGQHSYTADGGRRHCGDGGRHFRLGAATPGTSASPTHRLETRPRLHPWGH
jgi:hypothetical protein